MIRLAYIVHTFEMGGLERCVARLANHLDRDRFEPMIICLGRRGGAAGWVKDRDVKIFELGKRDGNDPGVVLQLARLLRRERATLVQSHNWGTLLETAVARRLGRVPLHVHAEHGTVLHDLPSRGLRRFLRRQTMRWSLERTTAVVAVAESVRERVTTLCGFAAEKIQVIPNGVEAPRADAAERQRIRRELGIGPDALVAGSVGRLAAVKDFATAIDAAAELSMRGRDFHLIIVGQGAEAESLARRASAARLEDRVHLVGPQVETGPFLAAMDCYANSSRSEGMSLSILEAMATGLPMVVTDVGESARLVGGAAPCGRVVPPGDPAALAAALEELLLDREARVELSANARRRFAERHSVEKMVLSYERLYEGLTSRARGRRLSRAAP
jgi:glycosyltransferase involved in cell wall biosynthesis